MGRRGLEGEAVQSELPVDVRDRGRPSAQFARESSPSWSTNKREIALAVISFLFMNSYDLHIDRSVEPEAT